MLVALGICENCQAGLNLQRALGGSELGHLCPVCGCKTIKWHKIADSGSVTT